MFKSGCVRQAHARCHEIRVLDAGNNLRQSTKRGPIATMKLLTKKGPNRVLKNSHTASQNASHNCFFFPSAPALLLFRCSHTPARAGRLTSAPPAGGSCALGCRLLPRLETVTAPAVDCAALLARRGPRSHSRDKPCKFRVPDLVCATTHAACVFRFLKMLFHSAVNKDIANFGLIPNLSYYVRQ